MSGLTVRTFTRNEIDLPVEFVICEEHRDQVRLSATSGAERSIAVRGRTMDVSHGGLGLVTRHFLPRMCEGVLRVFRPVATDGETPGHDEAPAFEHRVQVCRVTMQSPEPVYLIGLAFVNPDANIRQRVAQLLESLVGKGGTPDDQPTGGSRRA